MSDVIDWDEAMQQCGDDEEFLRELLGDLRSETDTQMSKIEETLDDSADSPFVPIMRASHVIKGAASNLMCAQLRQCAMSLETAASTAANDNADSNATHMATVKEKFEDLKVAVEAYHKYLDDVGV